MFLPMSIPVSLTVCFFKEKKTLLEIFMLGKGEQTEFSETDGRRVSKLVRMY